ncbi:hypothetical protein [Nocardia panacis]|nr:hypothetical protein [Nocardia panacis]
MSSAISTFAGPNSAPASDDLGFDSVARAVRPVCRVRRLADGSHRPAVGPRGVRPRAGVFSYGDHRVAPYRPHGAYPIRRVRRAEIGYAALALAALLSALAVTVLIGVAHWSASPYDSTPATVVVEAPH